MKFPKLLPQTLEEIEEFERIPSPKSVMGKLFFCAWMVVLLCFLCLKGMVRKAFERFLFWMDLIVEYF
jgi:hypothetical protein